MAYPFSEGMYGMGSGIMNMRRPPNWRKRILPRTPFSSYEAAYSTSPVVAPRTPQTPMAKKKGLGINDWMDAFSELKTFTPKFGSLSARGVGGSGIKPSPRPLGVDALEMASADDPRKKWWKQWQGLMGAV